MEKPVLFKCPTTGLTVEVLLKDREAPTDGMREYAPMDCPACGRFHLMNLVTGQLMSDERG